MYNYIKQVILNAPGSTLNRKILIIHSDDWGSIRMPSNKIRLKLNSHPLIQADNGYAYYDTLASKDDLQALFEVLSSVKDLKGSHAVLTANCLVANPNFKKIEASGFEKYYYEIFDDTFVRYKNEGALDLWDEGIRKKIFIPQFHGREHVNVPYWMKLLKNGHKGVINAFDKRVFGVDFYDLPNNQVNLQRAWDLLTPDACDHVNMIITDGLEIFHKRFGVASKTAIAPNYTWTKSQELLMNRYGVGVMQGILKQRLPNKYMQNYKYKNRFTSKGQSGKKLGFQRRNVFFEPSLSQNIDWVNNALQRIEVSFLMNKPAIIGSHRVNYVGVLNERNRNDNLKLLKTLLQKIIQKWPDTEFMDAASFSAYQLEGC